MEASAAPHVAAGADGEPVDPVTFEIIKNKLVRVVEEGITALQNCSGTAITSEMQDLCLGVYRPNGELVVVGLGFLHHVTAGTRAIRHIIENFGEDPGIFEGDVWFHNDQYVGALHAPDAYVISPIHWEGELTGFVATFVHITDNGATSPGGFSPTAKSAFDEGFMSRGLKIVERGKVRKDVFDTILNHSRDPGMLALDLKSQMAANHTAKDRLHQLYAAYGPDTVDLVGRRLIDQSEQLLRERLRGLPDGVWRARSYYDVPGDIRTLMLTATKKGDTLSLDCTGTSEQSPLPINCAYHASWGGAIAPLFPLLAWDLFWNDGILRVIEFHAPEGTIFNALKPAPMSLATIGSVQAMNTLAAHAASKMLSASEEGRDRATAVWAGAYLHFHYAATNADGEMVVAATTESVALAGGARSFADGVTTGGDIPNVVLRQANVETHESQFPFKTLYRRLVPDSGGPGKYRGGVTQEIALTPWGSPSGEMELVFMPGRATLAPLAQGISGGYPGCSVGVSIFRNANASELPYSFESTRGDEDEPLAMGDVHLYGEDIFYGRWTGGGGYGDPLDRDPELVLADVADGLVTEGPACSIYGVICDPVAGTVDLEATERQRRSLREERLGRAPAVDVRERHDVPSSGRPVSEYLQVAEAGPGERFLQCTWCGERLSDASAHWKEHCDSRRSSPSAAGPGRPDNGEFFLEEFFCPGCATLLEVDVVRKDDPAIHDEIGSWPERASGANG